MTRRRRPAGIGVKSSLYGPCKLVFDRTRRTSDGDGGAEAVETALFIACSDEICRFDLNSGELDIFEWGLRVTGVIKPYAIASLPTGLIVSCSCTHSIYCIDPFSGSYDVLVGRGLARVENSAGFVDGIGLAARFNTSPDVVVAEPHGCVYFCDSGNHRIRRLTLPNRFFQ